MAAGYVPEAGASVGGVDQNLTLDIQQKQMSIYVTRVVYTLNTRPISTKILVRETVPNPTRDELAALSCSFPIFNELFPNPTVRNHVGVEAFTSRTSE